jgi:hypothetical protein
MHASHEVLEAAVAEYAVLTNRPVPTDPARLEQHTEVWRRLVDRSRLDGVLILEDFTAATATLLSGTTRLLDLSPVHVINEATRTAAERERWARALAHQAEHEPSMLAYVATDRYFDAAMDAVVNSTLDPDARALVTAALTGGTDMLARIPSTHQLAAVTVVVDGPT